LILFHPSRNTFNDKSKRNSAFFYLFEVLLGSTPGLGPGSFSSNLDEEIKQVDCEKVIANC